MAKRSRKGRPVNGILVLDKAPGVTSNGALQTVKRLYGAAKAGHTGSLDPLATGVLPLCFGEATKFSQYLLDADKRYLTTFQLGVTTETGDADGAVIESKPVPVIEDEHLLAVLAGFEGEIDQIPSMYSALKHNGEPLYKLARQGIVVDRPSRCVRIHHLRLVERDADTVTLDIRCSKGTYVRSLAEDIGAELGCGAHVCALRRTASGPFREADGITIPELEALLAEGGHAALDALLVPPERAVCDWPAVELTETTAFYLRQGQPVQISRAPTEGWVRIFDGPDDFIGVGEVQDDGKIAPRRLVKS